MGPYPELGPLVGGKWRKAGEDMPVISPATEMEVGRLPRASVPDLQDVLEAAEEGSKTRNRTSPRDMSDAILRAAMIMRDRHEDNAQEFIAEHGKPLAQARHEVIRGAGFFEWDAGEAVRMCGRVIPVARGSRLSVHHYPVGVIAAFSPWIFPVSQPARKVAGALASACSIILKAAEETAAGVVQVVRAFEEAGLPAGVLNLVIGAPSEISGFLIPQPSVGLVTLTGSTTVGRQLTAFPAQHDTRARMELGGHAPVIVCEDIDVEKAALSGAIRKMRNAGQVCTSPTRFLVQESILDLFAERFIEHAEAKVVGNGVDEGIEMGTTASDRRNPVLTSPVEDAVSKGAKLCTGCARHGDVGYFFQPGVLTRVPSHAQIMQEEPSGPAAVLNPVSSLDEAISDANSAPFRLAGYGFTNRADNVDRMSDETEVGDLSIDTLEASLPGTPFGDIKSSYGREGGAEGQDYCITIKDVWHPAHFV